MKYKAFILCLIVVIFFNGFFGSYQAGKAAAASLPNTGTISKIVRAVGEKLGINWTSSSLAAAVGYLAGKADSILPDWEMFGLVPDTQTLPNPDMGQLLLSPDDFNKTAKAIKDATNTIVPNAVGYSFCGPASTNVNLPYFAHYWIFQGENDNFYTMFTSDSAGAVSTITPYGSGGYVNITVKAPSGTSGNYFVFKSTGLDLNTFSSTSNGRITDGVMYYGVSMINTDSNSCGSTWISDQVINNTNITTNTWNNIDNSVTSNYDTPSIPLTIRINNGDAYTDVTTSLNTKGTDIEINNYFQGSSNTGSGSTDPTPPADGSGSWWQNLFKPLFDFLSGLTNLITSLFVPDSVSISDQFSSLSDSFKAKMPISGQLSDFWSGLKGAVVDNEKVPTFDMTFPKEWGGGTYPIIDFSYFADYRTWVLNFIRFSAWFMFLKRLYNKIASMI